MAFVTDKEVLKPGLIIFRRADVDHRNWYCRVKLPKADRYKTISLKTSDVGVARHLASEQEVEVRAMLKHDIPVFNHPFRAVAKEYLATQEARAKRGEISKERPKKLKAVIEGALEDYVGSVQVHRIGDELWAQDRQFRLLCWIGGVAFAVGLLLSPIIAGFLPFGLNARVAALVMREDQWTAGSDLMKAGNAQGWDRLIAETQLARDNRETIDACRAAAVRTEKTQRCSVLLAVPSNLKAKQNPRQ